MFRTEIISREHCCINAACYFLSLMIIISLKENIQEESHHGAKIKPRGVSSLQHHSIHRGEKKVQVR
jgi:hypothetical protein